MNFWRFQEYKKIRNLKIAGSLNCNGGWTLLDVAFKGIGLIQLPDYYVWKHFENGRLITVLQHFKEKKDGVWAVYPHKQQICPNVRFLIDYLKGKLRS